MSKTQLPHIVRPLIPDDAVKMFQSTLSEIGIEPTSDPAMQLITTAELQTIPQQAKQSAWGQMSDLADKLSEGQATTAEVLRARIFFRKQIGYVSLSLAVGAEIGEERRSITNVLARHGVDIEEGPFKKYRYTTIVASCIGYPHGTPRQELFDSINATYPKRLELDSPTF